VTQAWIRETSVIDTSISGHWEPRFGPVADVLRAQLDRDPDSGASLGVYRDGHPVVTIWGGVADVRRGQRWTERTVTPLASTGKALASVAVLTLVERGLIDLDRPVAHYWPAFGQAGKADIPVHRVLSHRSGVAALDEPVSNDQSAALDPVLRRLERQRPWWPPGTGTATTPSPTASRSAAWCAV
jgi:CubicO group peptidase (beta-lactamase class C family)